MTADTLGRESLLLSLCLTTRSHMPGTSTDRTGDPNPGGGGLSGGQTPFQADPTAARPWGTPTPVPCLPVCGDTWRVHHMECRLQARPPTPSFPHRWARATLLLSPGPALPCLPPLLPQKALEGAQALDMLK